MSKIAATSTDDGGTREARPRLIRLAGVLIASVLLGWLTRYAENFLPHAFHSLAHSPSGWALLTVLLILVSRARSGAAAALGAAIFVLLVLGYTVGTTLDGLAYDPLVFCVIGIVAGPIVGIATAWLRSESPWRTAFGTTLLATIAIGDGLYGLTVADDTTGPGYWIVIGVIGLALLVGISMFKIRDGQVVTVAVIGTAVLATVYVFLPELIDGLQSATPQ